MKEIVRESSWRPLMKVVIDEKYLEERISKLTEAAMKKFISTIDEEATLEIRRLIKNQDQGNLLEILMSRFIFSRDFIDKLSRIIISRLSGGL